MIPEHITTLNASSSIASGIATACQTPFSVEKCSLSPFDRFTRLSIMPGTCNERDIDKFRIATLYLIILSNNYEKIKNTS